MPIMRTLCVVAVLLAAALALAEAKGGDWSKPYTPTKLEWLDLKLNELEVPCDTRTGCVGWSFEAKPPDTIVVSILAGPATPMGDYEATLNMTKNLIKMQAARISKSPIKVETFRSKY